MFMEQGFKANATSDRINFRIYNIRVIIIIIIGNIFSCLYGWYQRFFFPVP